MEQHSKIKEIAERTNMKITEVISVAIELLEFFLKNGCGENAMYTMPYDLWEKLYEAHLRYYRLH